MSRKLTMSFMILFLFLTGCTEKVEEEPKQETVIKADEGDYEMLSPFRPSPLRQIHGIGFREIDTTEVGRRLLDHSKEHFNVKKYSISDGQVIDVDSYYDLVMFKSEDNPDGLMTRYETLEIDGVTLEKPIFVSDIYELDFYKNDSTEVDGISVALVLKRLQYINSQTGEMHSLSDDALFNIGQTMGLQLSAYIRSLERMSDVPMYIGLYVQSSDMDKLPDNYLPGYFIGGGFSTERSMKFTRKFERWIMLSDNEAITLLPQVQSAFAQLKREITFFVGDESTGIIGRAFVVENKLDTIRLDINAPSKTYLELYGLGQFLSQELENLGKFGVPIKVNIDVHGKTRLTITKNQGEKSKLTVFE